MVNTGQFMRGPSHNRGLQFVDMSNHGRLFFLPALWGIIAVCMVYYFWGLQNKTVMDVIVILAASIVGMLGSYGVAWFGIRINTTANSRAAFAALEGNAIKTLFIPLRAGMSI